MRCSEILYLFPLNQLGMGKIAALAAGGDSLFSDTKHIHLTSFQDGRCIGPTLANEPEPLLFQNSITRKAGGKKAPEKEMQVILMITLLMGRWYSMFLIADC